MAKQTINIGTSPNARDGDPLRTAFDKVNDNFDELYAGNFADPEAIGSALKPDTDATYDLGASDKQWADLYVRDFIYLNGVRLEGSNGNLFVDGSVIAADSQGSVFGDDSTLLVDGVNNVINLNGTISTHIIPTTTETYDLGSAGNRFRDLYLSGSTINLGGLEITNDNGTITFGGEKVVVEGGTGDVRGSVFGDDSTLLVDGVNGKIVGNVDTSLIEASIVTSQGGNFNSTGQSLVVGAANGTATGGTVIVGGGVGTAGDGGTASLGGGTGSAGNGGMASVTGGTGSVNGGTAFLSGGTGSGGNGGKAYVNGGTGSAGTGGGVLVVGGPGSVTDGIIDIGTQDTSQVNIQNAVIQGDLTGSVFGDDSTLLVDGVDGKINLQNTVLNNTISTINDEALYLNTATIPGDRGGRITTTDNIFDIYGATLADGNGGGVWLAGGLAEPGKQQGDVIISGRFISLLGGDYDGSGGIVFNGPVVGRMVGDIQGSVFADDSTLLVDGVNGVIPTSVLEGDIPINSVDKFVNRSTFTSDFTINSGSATFLQFDAFQGSRAFDAITYQWSPANTGLYRLDFVLGLTESEVDQPLIVFLYNLTDAASQIELYNGNFTGSILSMSGTTYLTAGKNYQFGIIQNAFGDAIILDKDLTSVGIEELTRV